MLFECPYREAHNLAVGLLITYRKMCSIEDIPHIEQYITANSRRGTVDALAVNLFGHLLQSNHEALSKNMYKWTTHSN